LLQSQVKDFFLCALCICMNDWGEVMNEGVGHGCFS
jgi:hypothetical protein